MLPSIYPNPTNDKLTINLNDNKFNKLTIVNTLGQTLMEEKISNNVTTISTQLLVPGIYQLVLKGESDVRVIKIEKR